MWCGQGHLLRDLTGRAKARTLQRGKAGLGLERVGMAGGLLRVRVE